MHVIVTHPNADFDAVASLLGAWHLYPDAVPVLPPTLNRNVRDFITLYQNKLPFLHQNELERNPITRLTVVDTQYIPDLKNLQPGAAIHIIDHHEPHRPPPPGVILSLTDTGSTTTLLVEQIRELSKRLSSIEATLLLLGIYEDTGSLTYANTNPRDLQAAAWLLSNVHARLDIVREYLYYPMNDAQKELDYLLGVIGEDIHQRAFYGDLDAINEVWEKGEAFWKKWDYSVHEAISMDEESAAEKLSKRLIVISGWILLNSFTH